MSFSERLWSTIHPYYQKIAAHPFNVELAEGTLSKERFDFYIRQDISYLKKLSHVFTLISNRATTLGMRSAFLTFSKDAVNASDNLRALFLDSTQTDAVPSPACREYSDYLYTTANSATLEESVAAVLPCFWIYRELSKMIAGVAKGNNPYSQWIALNSCQTYSDMTDQVIAFVDEIAGRCSERVFGLMEQTCASCSCFEWRFWDDAYQMRSLETAEHAFKSVEESLSIGVRPLSVLPA